MTRTKSDSSRLLGMTRKILVASFYSLAGILVHKGWISASMVHWIAGVITAAIAWIAHNPALIARFKEMLPIRIVFVRHPADPASMPVTEALPVISHWSTDQLATQHAEARLAPAPAQTISPAAPAIQTPPAPAANTNPS